MDVFHVSSVCVCVCGCECADKKVIFGVQKSVSLNVRFLHMCFGSFGVWATRLNGTRKSWRAHVNRMDESVCVSVNRVCVFVCLRYLFMCYIVVVLKTINIKLLFQFVGKKIK